MNDIVERSQKLFSAGKELEAIELLLPHKDGDNIDIRSNLGLYMVYYCQNDDFPYFAEGLELLQDACKRGDPSACHNLGTLHWGSHPMIPEDRKKAAICYLQGRSLAESRGWGQIAPKAWYANMEKFLE